jgi:hypothetical protein
MGLGAKQRAGDGESYQLGLSGEWSVASSSGSGVGQSGFDGGGGSL